MASKSFGGTVKLTGESEYQSALKSITDNLKVLNSEMKLVTSQYDENDNSSKKLKETSEVLNKKIGEQESKVSILKKALEQSEAETGKNSTTTKKWQTQLNDAEAELNDLNKELEDQHGNLDKSGEKSLKLGDIIKANLISEGIIAGIKGLGKAIAEVGSAFIDLGKQAIQSYAEQEQLIGGVETLFKDGAEAVVENANNAYKTAGLNANEYMETVTSFAASLVQSTSKVTDENAQATVDALNKELENVDKVAKESLATLKKQQDDELTALKESNTAKLNEIKASYQAQIDMATTAAEKTALRAERDKAVEEEKARQNALITATKEANEQNYESTKATLESETALRKEELAKQIAETEKGVTAYVKTAEAYEEASRYADMAIIDMSDNANKMGTSMESIQNAYQGFAKQNYSMLDNLKLGYGGTQEEMYRLLCDAQAIDESFDAVFKLDSKGHLEADFADIVEAIHIVQTEMGITGTTSLEASQTISGSTGSMKAAWQNLITGIADDNADFETLVNNLVVSLVGEGGEGGFINNMLPRVQQALDGIVTMVVSLTDTLLPQIVVIGKDLILNLANSISENLPDLLESASTIIQTIVDGISEVMPTLLPVAISLIEMFVNSILENLETLMPVAVSIIEAVVTAILENLPMILQVGIDLIISLAQGITSMLPELIPLAVDAILNLVDTLLDNIDLIVDTGIDLILALADGLIKAMPQMIEKAPVIIKKLIAGFVDNFPKIVTMAGNLIGKMAGGLIASIPSLVSSIPQIITSLIDGFKNQNSNLKNIGIDLVKGIWQGVSGSFDWIKQQFTSWVGNVTSFIKKLFGINSPSRLFKDQIGTNLALGIGEGFTDTMSDVTTDMQDALPTEFDTSVTMNGSSSSYGSNYDYLITAFKEALKDVKVTMNNREMGAFIVSTVEREVYA